MGVLCGSGVYAATVDTGSIYRAIQKSGHRDSVKKAHPKYKTKEEHHALMTSADTTLIKEFKIVGNDEFSKSELNLLLEPFIGKVLTSGKITEAANILTEYFHTKGYFTEETSLRKDSIQEGIVTLVVEERHLEKNGISVQNKGKRVKSKIVQKLWDSTMKAGAMKQDDYERAMLLTNDLPGISAKSDMYFGQEAMTDDLIITVTDEKIFNGNIDIDNYGSYGTGETEVGTTLYWNSPTGNGEEIVARLITSGQYSNYGYIDVALPVLNNATRFGISLDYLDYENKHDAKGEGTAWNGNVYLKYPFVRSEVFTLEGEARYVHAVLKDNNATEQIDHTKIDKGVFKILGNRSDTFLLNGITYFDLSLTVGDVDLKNSENKQMDAMLYNTDGDFAKLNFSLSRYQNLVGDLSVKLSFDGQFASKNLDSSEKYSLGGPYAVTAYPVGEAAGDNAWVLGVEFNYDFYSMPWGGDFQLSAFYNYGWTELLKNPKKYLDYYSIDSKYNEIRLQTVGVGFSQTWTDSVVIRGMIGKQIGDNEYRDIPGNDHKDIDQSDSNYRAWIEAIYYF